MSQTTTKELPDDYLRRLDAVQPLAKAARSEKAAR